MIEFASIDIPERTPPRASTLDPTTVATLISTTTINDTGVTEIVSELHITASIQYPNSSVGCRNDGHGAVNSTTFQTLNGTYRYSIYFTSMCTCRSLAIIPSQNQILQRAMLCYPQYISL